jgi:hypothetical protein
MNETMTAMELYHPGTYPGRLTLSGPANSAARDGPSARAIGCLPGEPKDRAEWLAVTPPRMSVPRRYRRDRRTSFWGFTGGAAAAGCLLAEVWVPDDLKDRDEG